MNVLRATEKSESSATKPVKKRRTRAEKVGRRKYIIQLIKRLDRKIDKIDLRTRQMMAGLHEWMNFEANYIEEVVCRDQVDSVLIARLIQAGEGGISPSEIVRDMPQYGLKRWDVTRRIQRMNKKLTKELDKKVAEKRGRKWAATSFAFKVWGLSKEEVKEEMD